MKQTCIIVDIDGTLAKMTGRGPFEWHRVGEDKINPPVKEVVNTFYNHTDHEVIVLSGRDSVCRGETETWLKEHGVRYSFLYMRPHGDFRKDAIVKKELYQRHIEPYYDVVFVLDDRDQMVSLWRKDLQLACFQVDYGDF